jgi:hypothetical protein
MTNSRRELFISHSEIFLDKKFKSNFQLKSSD